MDTPTANLIHVLRERFETLREEGNLKEALHAATALVERCQQALSPDPDSIESFVSALECRGSLYLEMETFPEAAEDIKQAIDQLDGRSDRLAQIGRLHAKLGASYDGQDRPERTMDAWKLARDYFGRHEPPLAWDMAAMGNNLGFLAKASGDLDAAEDYFLKALEIMHAEVGQMHEETASVSNNLGAVYLAAGYLEQAREMHMIALATRRELFGESHPDTAQSHNNLALALLQTGDRAWARRHFEKALEGFESLGTAYSDDLEAVASNYCDFLKSEGEESLSEVIAGRVRELLAAN